MAAQVIPFAFQQEYTVRVILIGGEPWFCLRDVCKVLGLTTPSPERFQIDSKGVAKLAIPSEGGDQEATFINEPNLYRVIFRSNKPEAKAFQDWVFNDVLPTLRRQGRYNMPGAQDQPFIIMTQSECAAFIERCVTAAVRAATKAPQRARRISFSEWEKTEMLRLHKESVGATEIARRLNRSSGSVGNFLLHYRRNNAATHH